MNKGRLHDIEIRHLRALQTVAVEGSFGRAAARLGYSQAAISQQIAALERLLGEAVFDRPGGPRRVELTPVGRVLVEHAAKVLQQIERADESIDELRAGTAGRLNLGTFESVSVRVLPPVVGRLRAERPGLSISCTDSDDVENLLVLLQTGQIDATFSVNQPPDRRVERHDLMIDPFVLVSPADTSASSVDVRDLHGRPLIGQYPDSCQMAIDAELRAFGVVPEYVFRSNDNGAVQALVRNGLADAILPLLAVDVDDPGIRIRSLRPALSPRAISIVTWKDRTLPSAVGRLVELSKDVCAEIGRRRHGIAA
jgi:DNA-binding transcriptional LysR family regulator